MLADLVVTEGNPLADIRDAAAVRHVVKNGELFGLDEILGPFAKFSRASAYEPQPQETAVASSHWWHNAEYVRSSRAACCVDPACIAPAQGAARFDCVEI
jgi:hypothetical protein